MCRTCTLSMPYMTAQDKDDIRFGVEQGFDFIAASFVRSAADVLEIRRVLDERKCDFIKIIAKIENREGVEQHRRDSHCIRRHHGGPRRHGR